MKVLTKFAIYMTLKWNLIELRKYMIHSIFLIDIKALYLKKLGYLFYELG